MRPATQQTGLIPPVAPAAQRTGFIPPVTQQAPQQTGFIPPVAAAPSQPAAAPPPEVPPQAGGAQPPAAPRGKPKKGKKHRKKIIRGALSFLLLIALLVGAFFALEFFYPGSISAFWNTVRPEGKVPSQATDGLFGGLNGQSQAAPDASGNVAEIRALEDSFGSVFYNEDPQTGSSLARSDGTVMAFPGQPTRRGFALDLSIGVGWTRTSDPESSGPHLGDLAVVSGTGQRQLSVKAVRENYHFNTHKKVLYYITEEGELHRWQDGDDTKIAENVSSVAAAADDSYVLYRSGISLHTLRPGEAPAQEEDTSETGHEKFAEVGSNAIPLGISTDGNTVYYADPTVGAAGSVTIFCLQRGVEGGDSIQAQPKQDGYAYLAMSYTGLDAVVYAENGAWRCLDGKFEMVGIGDATISIGSRNFAQQYDNGAHIFSAYRASSAFDCFAFSVDGELYLQPKNAPAHLVNFGVTHFELSEDSTRLTYLREPPAEGEGGELYRCELSDGQITTERVVSTSAAGFDNSRDGDKLYYYVPNADGTTATLYYHNTGSREDDPLSDDLWLGGGQNTARYLSAAYNGDACYFISGYDASSRSGALYVTGPGGTGQALIGPAGAILSCGPGGALYAQDITPNAYNEAFLTCRLMWVHNEDSREVKDVAAISG
uniref:Uncharacterized protein n=1 Tax=termite gut metagenome TaxID=433724 RepID=S0DE91_9ZZZZ